MLEVAAQTLEKELLEVSPLISSRVTPPLGTGYVSQGLDPSQ